MTKKEPSEYIKAIIGIFATLITGAIIYLFSSNLAMQRDIIELKANQKHIQGDLPKVVEAVERNTDVIRGLEKIIERLTALMEDRRP